MNVDGITFGYHVFDVYTRKPLGKEKTRGGTVIAVESYNYSWIVSRSYSSQTITDISQNSSYHQGAKDFHFRNSNSASEAHQQLAKTSLQEDSAGPASAHQQVVLSTKDTVSITFYINT
eukprot:g36187.t1